MTKTTRSDSDKAGPRQRPKRHPYNDNVDEPPKLIDEEAADIERDAPAKENESVEGNGKEDISKSPAFEE